VEVPCIIITKKTSFAPSGGLELQKLELLEGSIKTDKKFVFALKDAEKGKTFIFSCANEEERAEWLSHLRANKDKAALPPPTNACASNKKGLKYSFETNVAASMLGRKLIKDALPAETWQVVDALCSFIKQVKGEDTAQAFKKSLVKIGTKVALLHHNKLISDGEVFQWRKAVLKLGATVVDFYQMPSIFDCQVITGLLNDIKRDMEFKLTPKLMPSSIEKFNIVFGLLADEALVTNFFQKKKWKELDSIAVIIRANSPVSRQQIS